MAIPVASLPFVPTATPDVPAAATPAATAQAGTTQPAAPGDVTPFRAALAAAQATPASQADVATAVQADVTTAELDAVGSPAADREPGIDTKTDADTDTDTDAALTADSSLVGLLAFVTQTLAPPENVAVAQATGQQTELLAATPATATDTTTLPTDVGTRTRADQLRLERGNPALPLPTTQTTPTTATAQNQTLTPATPAAQTAQPLPAAAQTNTTTQTGTEPALTPAAAAARAVAATPTGTGSSIPAQAPLVTNLIPPVPVPADLSVTAPPVSEPTAAVAAAGLPSAQLGERPATAGEQFAADATAGARLAVPAPGSAVFANTLAQETDTTAAANPVALTTAVPVAVTTAPATPIVSATPATPVTVDVARTPIDTAQPLLPVAVTPVVTGSTAVAVAPVTAGLNTDSPAPVATFGRAVADIARLVAQAGTTTPTAFATSFATEFNAGRPPADTIVPVAPARSDDAPPESSFGAAVVTGPTPPAATTPPTAVHAPVAARATPAVQVADTIVTHAHAVQRDGGVEFQMRLDPPDLGRLHIRLVTQGDEVHGHVIAASEAVRGMIESQLPELRQRLEAAGVNVNRFEVSADPNSGGGRNPYRDAAPEFAPRTAGAPANAPRARVGRPDGGALDVTV